MDNILDLKLKYSKPGQVEIEEFRYLLKEIARDIQVPVLIPLLPENGFLAMPLSQKELNIINTSLSPKYAKDAVAFQEQCTKIQIDECGEKMVSLQEGFEENGIKVSFSKRQHPDCCTNRERVFWARETLVKHLILMGKALNSIGLQMHVEDMFRQEGVQEGMYRWMYSEVRKKSPHLSSEQAKVEAKSKIASCAAIAAHKSGAAIDITLRIQEGTSLDIGNKYLDSGAIVSMNFPYVTWEQFKVRYLFSQTAKMAGMVVYPWENWHCNLGDTTAAALHQESNCRYGPIKGFDQESGEIIPYNPEEYYTEFPVE